MLIKKNAVIMAAGKSSRFMPLSIDTPKGLLKVRGEILIERQINQLMDVGINDIYIVVGYLKDKFFYLKDKYPNIEIIVNEDYQIFNNPSSLYRVMDRLNNTYICSSDNYFLENPFNSFDEPSYYSVQFCNGNTPEYCVSTDQNNYISSISVGGRDSWYMIGHAYFKSDFSKIFIELLKEDYKEESCKISLWEDFLAKHLDVLKIEAKKYNNTIYEFDSIDEIQLFDCSFIDNIDSKIIRNICSTLKCNPSDLSKFKLCKSGLTNISFTFCCYDKTYIYRHPGIGTDKYINRQNEKQSMMFAKKLLIDKTYIHMYQDGGKISKFLDNSRELDYHNEVDVNSGLLLLRKLHNANISVNYYFDVISKIETMINTLPSFEFLSLHKDIISLYKKLSVDGCQKQCLCHCDSYSPNFLIKDDEINLIDWEYSGMCDPAMDLGTFICCSDYTYEQAISVLKEYLGCEDKKMIKHYLGYVAVASYYWFVWSLMQESLNKSVGEYMYIWFKYTKDYLNYYRNF